MQYTTNRVFNRTKKLLSCENESYPSNSIVGSLRNQGMRRKDAEFVCAILAAIDEKGKSALDGITQMILDDNVGIFPS